jgi:molybdate transport system substrate-binding protein
MPRRLPLLLCLVSLGCGSAKPAAVTLYAAASTQEAVEQVAAQFTAATGVPVALNFGPTSTLARQIEHGAAADLLLSADEPWTDYLRERNLVERGRPLLTNHLVVVVPTASPLTIRTVNDLAGPDVKRLAVAAEEVPAGRYARQALKAAGVAEAVAGRLLTAGDVRATLAFVERGEADAGLVYATDAAGRDGVRVALALDPSLHKPIVYPLVLLRRPRRDPQAEQLYEHFAGGAAAEVFRRAGFGVAEAGR